MSAPYTNLTLDLIHLRERDGAAAPLVARELGWDMPMLRSVCIRNRIALPFLDAAEPAAPDPECAASRPIEPLPKVEREWPRVQTPGVERAPRRRLRNRRGNGLVRKCKLNINTMLTVPDRARVDAEIDRRGMTAAAFVGAILERLIDTDGFDALLDEPAEKEPA